MGMGVKTCFEEERRRGVGEGESSGGVWSSWFTFELALLPPWFLIA